MKKMKPKFKKFNDLKVEDINFDFHIHTSQTDGTSTPEEIIEKAIILKLQAIALTEHVNKSSEWFNDFKKRIDVLKGNGNIKIFLGIETKANDFNGTLDATVNMINKSDIVMGVVHRYPDGKGGLMPLNKIKNLSQDEASKIEFRTAFGLLKNKNIDVLGHPFGVYSKFFNKLPKYYFRQLLARSLEKGIAIEINTKYILEKNLFFELLKEGNPFVSIGSDAHDKEGLTRSFDIIKAEIKK